MTRLALILPLLAAPAAAQLAAPEYRADDLEVGVLSCDLDGTEVGCLTDISQRMTFCMAVDAEGEPLANSIFVGDDGTVVFRNVEASDIASLRCRPEA
jgi:hypothetical protein